MISHRFRGFAPHENTLAGLKAALDFGVQWLEFDIRVARDGTPLIYHDEYAWNGENDQVYICDIMRRGRAQLGGAFAHMPTYEALLDLVKHHPNKTAKLLVDIKDQGFETEIHALTMASGLGGRVTYVSWLAEVLYRLHHIAPSMPLCISHWCAPVNDLIRRHHKVYESPDGHIPRDPTPYRHGERMGWAIPYKDGLAGEMRDILKRVKGSVCVPQNMITRHLVHHYHKDDIQVSTFSYTDFAHLKSHKDEFNIDLYFIDNKEVFDGVSS